MLSGFPESTRVNADDVGKDLFRTLIDSAQKRKSTMTFGSIFDKMEPKEARIILERLNPAQQQGSKWIPELLGFLRGTEYRFAEENFWEDYKGGLTEERQHFIKWFSMVNAAICFESSYMAYKVNVEANDLLLRAVWSIPLFTSKLEGTAVLSHQMKTSGGWKTSKDVETTSEDELLVQPKVEASSSISGKPKSDRKQIEGLTLELLLSEWIPEGKHALITNCLLLEGAGRYRFAKMGTHPLSDFILKNVETWIEDCSFLGEVSLREEEKSAYKFLKERGSNEPLRPLLIVRTKVKSRRENVLLSWMIANVTRLPRNVVNWKGFYFAPAEFPPELLVGW
jgi:hypothetical protein